MRAYKKKRTPVGKPLPNYSDRNNKDVYYDHWGYPYLYAYPYAYPLWWTPVVYPGYGCPGYVAGCAGGVGGCVAGTCGGGVAAGACGGAGVSNSSSITGPLLVLWGEKDGESAD